jgi:PTH2 family peptidyl-tRNA hydrolase
MKVFFNRILERPQIGDDGSSIPSITIPLDPEMSFWVFGKFTKVVVGVETETELLALRDAAYDAKLPYALIQDCGDTEFGGKPTFTALAIGPASADKLDPVTGHLKLL